MFISVEAQGLLEVVGGIVLVVEHLREPVSVSSSRWSKGAYVVTLGLEPVQWLLSALVALGKIASAPRWMSMTLEE